MRHSFAPGYIYWCYSPEGDGMTFWNTEKGRDEYAQSELRNYLDSDEGWYEEVQGVVCGVVTHSAQQIDIQRPVGVIDEEGYDEEGEGPWSDELDCRCNYKMLPVKL